MSGFRYEALTREGKKAKGVIEADNRQHAQAKLKAQGLIPVEIKPAASRQKKIKRAQLTLITRQLATLIEAGIPLSESLHSVYEQSDNPHVKSLLLSLREKVEEGYSLSQAMDNFPHIFPQLFRASVKAGESSGDLSKVLLSLADYLESTQAMQAKITQALIYPSFVMAVAIIFTIVLMATVVPQMLDVFADSDEPLPAITNVLLFVSNTIQSIGIYVLIALIAAAFGFKKWVKKTENKIRFHRFIEKLPVIGPMNRIIQTARFLRTLALLLFAGVPLLDAMEGAKAVVTHLPLVEKMDVGVKAVREGKPLSQALKESAYFSPMSLYMIASGERTGVLEPMMERAATNEATQVQQTITKGLALFEPIMILMMGLVVLFIVLSVLLPVFSATHTF